MDALVRRNIPLLRWFYAAQESVVMTVPIIVFYWLDRGLSMADVLFLQAAYAATVAILEVPSGYISDWFSRRTSLLVSAGFLALGLWGYLLSYDFFTFLLSELCFGFAVSFYSGTLESMTYESHAESVRDTEGRRSWARVMEWTYLMQAAYAIVGSLIAGYAGITWALGMSAVIGSTAIVAAWWLVEPERVRARDVGVRAHHHFLDILSNTVLRNKKLLYIFFVFAWYAGVSQLGLWYYQPVAAAGGIGIEWMGFVFASFYVFVLAGSRAAVKFTPTLGFRFVLLLPLALLLVGYASMAQWLPAWGWLGIFAHQVARGMARYLQPAEINVLVPDDRRATVHSIASLAGRGTYAALLFASGTFVAGYPLAVTLWVFAGLAAVLLALAALIGIFLLPRSEHRPLP